MKQHKKPNAELAGLHNAELNALDPGHMLSRAALRKIA
jgi:hypothetical protein